MCKNKSATEIIRELVTYTDGVQVIAALKYGLCPFLGYVLDNPTEDNIETFTKLLTIYGKVKILFKDELSEASRSLLEEAKKRQQEVDKGFVEDG